MRRAWLPHLYLNDLMRYGLGFPVATVLQASMSLPSIGPMPLAFLQMTHDSPKITYDGKLWRVTYGNMSKEHSQKWQAMIIYHQFMEHHRHGASNESTQ